MKICIQAVLAMNFTNSFSNFGVYIEKIKVKWRPPYENQTLRKNLKHQIEVDNNRC